MIRVGICSSECLWGEAEVVPVGGEGGGRGSGACGGRRGRQRWCLWGEKGEAEMMKDKQKRGWDCKTRHCIEGSAVVKSIGRCDAHRCTLPWDTHSSIGMHA